MIILSPGVYTAEYDFSYYSQILGTSALGIVSTATKGPTNERTLVTNEANLIRTFGKPTVSNYGVLAAIRFLRKGNILWFVRVAGYSEATAEGIIKNVLDSDAVRLTALSSGSWSNSVTIQIADSTHGGGKRIIVLDGGVAVERYENVSLTVGSPNYIETVINGNSDYFTATVLVGTSPMKNGTYTMSGGDDGSVVTDADLIGSYDPVTGSRTGMKLFANAEAVDINLLAVPGYSSDSVVTSMLELCENRGDCLALIDAPYGLSVQNVVDWHNGTSGLPNAPTVALNSSYGALFYPWIEVFDGYTGADLWVPPSGHVAGICAYTDYNNAPWFAPAGFNRGRLIDAKDLEYSPDQGERDYMYGGTNAVNPFVKFVPDGITLWGQKTLYRASSALNRINVRRMMLYAKKLVATSCRYLTFEPNDDILRRQFINLVDPIFADIKAGRGLYDFRVVCDGTNNTATTIDRNELIGDIYLKPTKTSEVIKVGFNLLSTGASFTEF